MALLIDTSIASLHGYVEDESGKFGWAAPDDEVHVHINEAERLIGTYLYGRRMYETMAGWETDPGLAAHSPLMRDYAKIWQAAEKIVYSTTLVPPSTSNTRIERHFAPEYVRHLKQSAANDLAIGGAALAAHAFDAGLLDECRLYLIPIVIGRGKPSLPVTDRRHLDLLAERRFANGTVYLRYRIRP